MRLEAEASPGRHPDPRPRRITPNLFGISFGIAGLAEAWGAASNLYGLPSGPADVLWLLSAAIWGATLAAFLRDVRRSGRASSELLDPTFAPFIALASIVPMLCGTALAAHAHAIGVLVFGVSMAVTVGLGGVLTGQWMISAVPLDRWHPGYFLPTLAGGYLGSLGCATLGFDDLATAMFGYGTLSWLALGPILWQRMFTGAGLPAPLLPTTAILVAPPVVGGIAWFEMNGGRVDTVALGLGGYACLMVIVQLRVAPTFRAAPFGPGWWAFCFSYAAVFVDAIRWLDAEQVPHGRAWTELLLAVLTTAVLALVARTVVAVARGSFLPTPQPHPGTGDDASTRSRAWRTASSSDSKS